MPTGTPDAGQPCVGDCNEDGLVIVNELLIAVRIALEEMELSLCPIADADGDEAVRIPDLITAIGHALNGCPGTAGPLR